MPSAERPVAVVGRFPPPLDGQALATARLADLLASPMGGGHRVSRYDVGAPDAALHAPSHRLSTKRVVHFLRLPFSLRRALSTSPAAPILWTSVSPSTLGHVRDLAVVVPTFGRRPVVGVVHRGDFTRLFHSPLTATTGRALVHRLDALVFLSESLAERCGAFVPPEKRWVIPNTIDAATIPSSAAVNDARKRRHERTGVRILFLSNMIPSKGYDDVLSALSLLRRRGLDASGTFVGGWPSAKAEIAFRQRAADLDLSAYVNALGSVTDRDQVRAHLLDADIFALPTTYPIEAQPLTVIEALAAGTPVVVTRQGGLPEMIDDGCEGRFVPAHTPAAIADAVGTLLDPHRWGDASVAARTRFDCAFSPEAVGRRWQEALARI